MEKKDNKGFSRRAFLGRSTVALAAGGLGISPSFGFGKSEKTSRKMKNIKITHTDSNFEREPLYPYRFKGSAITQAWQAVALMQSDSGIHKIGIGTQGTLWSDKTVFQNHSTTGGNALMYAMTERALQIIKGNSFVDPM